MTMFKKVLLALVYTVMIPSVLTQTPVATSTDLLALPVCAQSEGASQKPDDRNQVKQGLTGRELYDEAIAVSKLLRDPSSANNTLFESETALSGELKALIYQKLREGSTRGEILDYMAERYGEAVRYQPDFNATTFLLWAAPWIAVVLGALIFWRSIRRKKKPVAK